MLKPGFLFLGVGVVAGLAALLAMNSAAEAAKPPGQKAQNGDDVEVDPGALGGLFTVPSGTTSIVVHVLAAGPTDLTGRPTGVFVTAPDPTTLLLTKTFQALPPSTSSFTVPRTSVIAATRGGRTI